MSNRWPHPARPPERAPGAAAGPRRRERAARRSSRRGQIGKTAAPLWTSGSWVNAGGVVMARCPHSGLSSARTLHRSRTFFRRAHPRQARHPSREQTRARRKIPVRCCTRQGARGGSGGWSSLPLPPVSEPGSTARRTSLSGLRPRPWAAGAHLSTARRTAVQTLVACA